MLFNASRIVPYFIFACIIFLLSCRLPGGPSEDERPLRVYFIDVGQGDACLLQTPENRFILYDAGNEPWKVAELLRTLGADTLQTVFVSHPDFDHFGSLSSLLREFPTRKVFLPNATSPDSTWQALLRDLDEFHIQKDTLYAGDSLAWDDVSVKVLWPSKHFSGANNDLSQVLRVGYRGRSLLLTGDIENEAESGILASRAAVAAEILKVAHHGSRSSSSLPFLAAIHPAWAIISCDSTVYGHPHPETMADLKLVMEDSTRILRTDRVGTVAFEMDSEGVRRIQP